jgi:putative ABC transport system substrate-binding protein
LKSVAGSLKFELRALEVSDARTMEAVFAALMKEPPDALALCWDVVTLKLAKPIGEFALKLRVPTIAAIREYVDAGALLSYGTDAAGQRRRAAYYLDKIRNGKKPSELPIEQAAAFDTVVNITTAKRIGVVLPPYFMQTIEGRVE